MWQWFWNDARFADTAKIRHYLVDFEGGMNSKGFRTHTPPPHDTWLDIADFLGSVASAARHRDPRRPCPGL